MKMDFHFVSSGNRIEGRALAKRCRFALGLADGGFTIHTRPTMVETTVSYLETVVNSNFQHFFPEISKAYMVRLVLKPGTQIYYYLCLILHET